MLSTFIYKSIVKYCMASKMRNGKVIVYKIVNIYLVCIYIKLIIRPV